jgi:arabinan endo-1,5-alpha-L-arabinosidase
MNEISLSSSQDLNEIIMKLTIKILAVVLFSICLTKITSAQIGKPFIHDPSTIMQSDGKYFTFGTGGGGLVSEDGWNWNGGGVRPGG